MPINRKDPLFTPLASVFGNRLRHTVGSLEINIKPICDRMGVSPQTMLLWYKGDGMPDMVRFTLLASYLKVRPDWLLAVEDYGFMLGPEGKVLTLEDFDQEGRRIGNDKPASDD